MAKSCITVCFTYSLKMAIFLNTDISPGSVATRLGCGGVYVYDFVTNYVLSLTVKEFWKSVNIWWSYGQELGVCFFWFTVYTGITSWNSTYLQMIYNSPNICTVTQTNEANVHKMNTYIMNDAIDWGGIITVTDRTLKILIFFLICHWNGTIGLRHGLRHYAY